MKVYICVLLCLQGCSQVVTQPQSLHDGRWGDYNELMGEQCANESMEQGIKHVLPNELIDALFNKCVFDQGLTI